VRALLFRRKKGNWQALTGAGLLDLPFGLLVFLSVGGICGCGILTCSIHMTVYYYTDNANTISAPSESYFA
jgi:hypothetical protein